MQPILRYIKEYIQWINWRIFVPALLFISLAIFINYYYRLPNSIRLYSTLQQFAAWFSIFFIAFSIGYGLQTLYKKSGIFYNRQFVALLLLAPALFAWKMVSSINLSFSTDEYLNAYWNHVFYWPSKLIVIAITLLIVWRLLDRQQPFYGFSIRQFRAKPYWIMLLMMVPLIAAASTRPDFLVTYPKLKNIYNLTPNDEWYYQLLYELSYGTDFLSVELFFRGFLVLAFAKWVGKDAILPMALFYCTIHFGKPLGECISSFFGGLVLGVVTYHTKTIWGGLIVHLGIAWLMELGGYLGNLYLLSH
jgi:hypothetical protein